MSRLGQTALAILLIASVGAAVMAAALVFGGLLPPFVRPPVTDAAYHPPVVALEALSYADMEGWRSDDHARALAPFLRSCDLIDTLDDAAPANPLEALGQGLEGHSLSGKAGDWREACAAARAFDPALYADAAAAASAARALFEFHFQPVRLVSRRTPLPDGPARHLGPRTDNSALITGYFEPAYEATTFRTRDHSAPVLKRPANLVTVDLGAFRSDFAGERIAGFVENGALKPFPGHREINEGALDSPEPIAWVDPNDLFFLQIQGSGRLRLQNGREVRVGYDGQNGKPYTPIGRLLVERGALSLETVSMQTIRAWLDAASPEEARALREANESYVFFRVLDDLPDPSLGPLGAGGVQLEAARSIAADRRYYAMGAPVWLAAPAVDGRSERFARLMVAQDTGGAIRGPQRADIFLGAGPEAGEAAGRLRAEGEMILLVPRPVAERLQAAGALDAPGRR